MTPRRPGDALVMVGQEASALRIETLGGLAIERDGAAVDDLASSKAEALLVYLACTGREHPREVLAELLWDDRSQRQALANLRVVLSSLRKEVGPFVSITRSTAAINREADVWLDVAQVERAAQTAQEAEGAARGEAVEALEEALVLYEGDFLAGFFLPEATGFDDWAASERERLHRLAMDGLQRAGHWRLQQGDYGAATRWATQLVKIDPLAEVGHRQLMEALARSGQRAEALAQYEACRENLAEELGVEPQKETQALYETIRMDALPAVSAPDEAAAERPSVRHNLPPQPAPFVGRQEELDELDELIDDGATRLITVVGLGGTGKTRLALAVAKRQLRHHSDRFADGVFFISLVPADEPEQIVPLVAQAVGLDLTAREGEGGSATQHLLNYLRHKHLLLILDNFEHLAEGAGLLATFLEHASGLTLLVTSREPLLIREEQLYPVRGFPVGEWHTVEEAKAAPLVQLFLQSARRVAPWFELVQDDVRGLAEIGALTGGMPLVIELAASWVNTLSVQDIAEEIERSPAFLETEVRDMPERQRSVEVVFDASWQRLGAPVQDVFARLSVFRGGFSRKAAQEVAGATLKNLAAMVAKSLVRYDIERDRYYIHELLRQFGEEKLEGEPELEQETCQRHAAFYCRFLHERQQAWNGAGAEQVLVAVEREMGNVRSAWRWAASQGAVSLLAKSLDSLCAYYNRRGYHDEARELLRVASDAMLSRPVEEDDDVTRRRFLVRLLCWRSRFFPSFEEAGAVLDQAETMLEALQRQEVDVRREDAFVALRRGLWLTSVNPRAARPWFQRSQSLYRELGDVAGHAGATGALGSVEWHLGNYTEAAEIVRQALEEHKALGDRSGVATGLKRLGLIEKHRGRMNEALEAHRESYALCRQLGVRTAEAEMAANLASTLHWSGKFREARVTVMEGLQLAKEVGLHDGVAFLEMMVSGACIPLRRYGEAQQYAERAIAAARVEGRRQTLGFALMFSGQLHLVAGAYEEAGAQLEEAATTLSGFDKSTWTLPLVYHALALKRLGRVGEARRRLAEAMRESMRQGVPHLVISALPAAAELVAEQGDVRRAVALYALACRYPFVANSGWFEDVMGGDVAEWESAIPADELETARERGRSRDLWQTAEALVSELGGDAS
ncbi:MAG: ATP-binding protein [Chloroflexota bacterium]